MKKAKVITLVLLLICAIMFVSHKAVAQVIEVTPAEWDFGDVEVGSYATQIFQVNSTDLYEDLVLYRARICVTPPPEYCEPSLSFSITSSCL